MINVHEVVARKLKHIYLPQTGWYYSKPDHLTRSNDFFFLLSRYKNESLVGLEDAFIVRALDFFTLFYIYFVS